MLTVALIAFALFRYVGDPINNMVGQDTTIERAELKERLGLNDPFIIQFYRFVRTLLLVNLALVSTQTSYRELIASGCRLHELALVYCLALKSVSVVFYASGLVPFKTF